MPRPPDGVVSETAPGGERQERSIIGLPRIYFRPTRIQLSVRARMGILRKASIVAFFFAIVTALVVARFAFGRIASAQRLSGEQVPTFEVDPLWPKPLPNHWILGQTIGVAVD